MLMARACLAGSGVFGNCMRWHDEVKKGNGLSQARFGLRLLGQHWEKHDFAMLLEQHKIPSNRGIESYNIPENEWRQPKMNVCQAFNVQRGTERRAGIGRKHVRR